jgi:hypothetical protein
VSYYFDVITLPEFEACDFIKQLLSSISEIKNKDIPKKYILSFALLFEITIGP